MPFVLLWLTIWDYVARTSLPTLSLSFPFVSFSPSILIAKAFIQIILFYFTLFRSNNKIYATLGKSKTKQEEEEEEAAGVEEEQSRNKKINLHFLL